MPRVCSVCRHPDRHAIDLALVASEPFRDVAGRYGLSKSAVERHKAEHLPVALSKAKEAAELAEADDLLGQLRDLQKETLEILDEAKEAKRWTPAVLAIGQARQNIELMAKLVHQLDERPQINIMLSAEWRTLQAVIVQTLEPYPEAKAALVGALAEVGRVG